MRRLREEGGCPWDRKQTRDSLKPFLIEEAYEVIEAIEEGSAEKIKEELGDLLFQIIFHARIAEELGEFDLEDIINTTVKKMIKRHPHVFGDKQVEDAQEVLMQWEQIKRQENGGSLMDGIPRHLPGLLRAHRLQERAARVGFDWTDSRQVVEKTEEEWKELKEALKRGDPQLIEKELGDILFSLVNLSRFLQVNPEDALRKSIDEFVRRFQYIERELARQGKSFDEVSLTEMDLLWEEAKGKEEGHEGRDNNDRF